jgi:predicted HTH transcriptional regulator
VQTAEEKQFAKYYFSTSKSKKDGAPETDSSAEQPGVDSSATEEERLIAAGEGEKLEFKSTLRWNLNADKADKAIENSALKTVVAFLNTEGGTLLVGIKDDGSILGIEKDQFLSEDKYLLHFAVLLNERIGREYIEHIHWGLREINGKKILRVDCDPSSTPAFLKSNGEEFFVRNGPSSIQMSTSEVLEYSRKHFR